MVKSKLTVIIALILVVAVSGAAIYFIKPNLSKSNDNSNSDVNVDTDKPNKNYTSNIYSTAKKLIREPSFDSLNPEYTFSVFENTEFHIKLKGFGETYDNTRFGLYAYFEPRWQDITISESNVVNMINQSGVFKSKEVGNTSINYEWDTNIIHLKTKINIDVVARQETPATDFEYEESETEVTLTKYIGSSPCVVVPATINDKPVTTLKDTFKGNEIINQVEIPEGVTSLDGAFYGATNLRFLNLPESVLLITNETFHDCKLLSDVSLVSLDAWCACTLNSIEDSPFTIFNIISPDFVWWFLTGESAILNVGGKYIQDLKLNHDVGDYCFSGLQQIETVVISEGCTSIGNGAFNSNYMTSVTIPESLTTIEEDAFAFCYKLEKVNISNWESWSEVQFGNFCSNPASMQETQLLLSNEQIGSKKIPANKTELKDSDVLYLNGIKEIIIPNTVSVLNEKTFYGINVNKITFENNCQITNITNVFCNSYFEYVNNLPKSLTAIGQIAFKNCKQLKTITFEPNSNIKIIGKSAFEGCSSLQTINIPSAATKIEESAFFGCKLLEQVFIPKSVTSIETGAFAYNIPSSLLLDAITELGSYYAQNVRDELTANNYFDSYETICATDYGQKTPHKLIVKYDSSASEESKNKMKIIFEKGSKLNEFEVCMFACCQIDYVVIPSSVKTIWDSFNDSYVSKILYEGTKKSFNNVAITCTDNTPVVNGEKLNSRSTAGCFKHAEVYYYSDIQPNIEGGNYWHNNAQGEPEIWP